MSVKAAMANMRPTTPNYNAFHHAPPSSPPETPTTATFSTDKSRRFGILNFPPSIPISTGGAIPHGHPAFAYNLAGRPEDLSPRSSATSSEASGSPPHSLTSDAGDYLRNYTPTKPTRVVKEGAANFTIEEFRDSEYEEFESDDDAVIRPHQYEDAESDHARSYKPSNELPHDILSDLRDLDCDSEQEDTEAWLAAYRAQKRERRRSSMSVQKRTISQSIGSDTDDEDVHQFPFDASEVGSSARRLRRRVGERSSLIFDDPPPRIPEMEEPESCEEITEVDANDEVAWQAFDRELPYSFYIQDMEVDSSDEDDDE